MLVLYLVTVGYDRLLPMLEGIVALGVPEAEEIVVLTADTGTEGTGF